MAFYWQYRWRGWQENRERAGECRASWDADLPTELNGAPFIMIFHNNSWYVNIKITLLLKLLKYNHNFIYIHFSLMSSGSDSNQPETWNTSASQLGRCCCLHHWDWRWRFLQAGPEQEPDKWAGEPGPAESTDTMTEEWSDWRGCWRRKRRREEEKKCSRPPRTPRASLL